MEPTKEYNEKFTDDDNHQKSMENILSKLASDSIERNGRIIELEWEKVLGVTFARTNS